MPVPRRATIVAPAVVDATVTIAPASSNSATSVSFNASTWPFDSSASALGAWIADTSTIPPAPKLASSDAVGAVARERSAMHAVRALARAAAHEQAPVRQREHRRRDVADAAGCTPTKFVVTLPPWPNDWIGQAAREEARDRELAQRAVGALRVAGEDDAAVRRRRHRVGRVEEVGEVRAREAPPAEAPVDAAVGVQARDAEGLRRRRACARATSTRGCGRRAAATTSSARPTSTGNFSDSMPPWPNAGSRSPGAARADAVQAAARRQGGPQGTRAGAIRREVAKLVHGHAPPRVGTGAGAAGARCAGPAVPGAVRCWASGRRFNPARAASGFCRAASQAPSASAAAEQTKPRRRPPGPSASQPVRLGPRICPAAKTIVNAAMPAAQAGAGRLWRTKAVVDATTDRNVRSEQQARGRHDERLRTQHRQQRGDREQRVQQRERLPAAKALQQARPQPRRRDRAEPRAARRTGDPRRGHALLAQQRDDEGHVADVAEAEHQVARKRVAHRRPARAAVGGGVRGRGGEHPLAAPGARRAPPASPACTRATPRPARARPRARPAAARAASRPTIPRPVPP